MSITLTFGKPFLKVKLKVILTDYGPRPLDDCYIIHFSHVEVDILVEPTSSSGTEIGADENSIPLAILILIPAACIWLFIVVTIVIYCLVKRNRNRNGNEMEMVAFTEHEITADNASAAGDAISMTSHMSHMTSMPTDEDMSDIGGFVEHRERKILATTSV